jgi:glycerophosphoryl diester phosphodiesterase
MKRIGHKGADLIAPGNTIASFEAALSNGCDMVEFDVLPERPDGSGGLVLAHDFVDAGRRTPLTLEQGLDHFATAAYAGVELDVDLKLPGYERQVVDALRERGLAGRTLISTMETESLRAVRALAPDIRLGWSVPKVKRDYLASRWTKPVAYAAIGVLRRRLPAQAARAVREGRVDALMAHWSVVTPRLASALHDAGGELYVWTVDDAGQIAGFEAMGVTGVITNDPRLFAPS